MKNLLVLALFMATFINCSSSNPYTTSTRTNLDPFFIYEDEILEKSPYYMNIFDFISEARPRWLKGERFYDLKGVTISYPDVYINDIRYGEGNSLKNISIQNVYEIEYLQPNDAVSKYGTNVKGGIIIVKIQE